jgi:hypothetical protein
MVLAGDVDKPVNVQPRIYAKMPTVNQQRKLVAVLSELEATSVVDRFDALLDVAAMVIVGWDNIPVECNREGIGDVLDLEEIVEVLTHLMTVSHATPDDKKKSDSQP